MTRVYNPYRPARRLDDGRDNGSKHLWEGVAPENGVHSSKEFDKRTALGNECPERRLKLGGKKSRLQSFSGDIPERQSRLPFFQTGEIHEIPADVVCRPGEQPEPPPRKFRAPVGHQSALHSVAVLKFVLRQQLILQLEHQDEEDQDKPDRHETLVGVCLCAVDAYAHKREEKAGEEERPPCRRKIDQHPPEQPPPADDPADGSPEPLDTRALVVGQHGFFEVPVFAENPVAEFHFRQPVPILVSARPHCVLRT